VLTQAAPVRVVPHLQQLYLPLLRGSQAGGVWYLQAPSDGATAILPPEVVDQATVGQLQAGDQDGAIVPTNFLSPGSAALQTEDQTAWRVEQVLDEVEPGLLALDGRWSRAYLGLSGGELVIFNLSSLAVENRIFLGADLESLAPASQAGMVYAALSSGEVVRIDTILGEVTARAGGLDRPRGVVFDPHTEAVLIADAGQGKIVRFKADLSAQLGAYALEDLPGQMWLDPAGRRLYVLLPGVRRVLALDADTLGQVAGVELSGGPLIEMTLDAERDRVYVLSALSPGYRAIWVLSAEDLSRLALVAGSPTVPLRRAAALAFSPGGQLLVAEGAQLYGISPEDFHLVARAGMTSPAGRGGLEADPATGRLVWIGPGGVWVVDTSARGVP
jgi:DNA-binding beta-propeller fold protein YncE